MVKNVSLILTFKPDNEFVIDSPGITDNGCADDPKTNCPGPVGVASDPRAMELQAPAAPYPAQ